MYEDEKLICEDCGSEFVFTAGEQEFFAGKGLSNKEIADVLFISTHTVISHRKNIARKLNIHSTAGLTIYAIVNKLVDINSMD